ncbi:MAG: ATP-binding protein [Porphyromonas sp.]|nr:ATP-binding protein [Porphyromonas sp.]
MKLKTQYAKRLFSWTLLIVALFAGSLVVVEQREERLSMFNVLTSKLDAYNRLIETSYRAGQLDSVALVLPQDLRVTIVKNDGEVVMDNEAGSVSSMENHNMRPELREARFNEYGTAKRMSTTLNQEFLYYAKYYDEFYVRTALPYDMELQSKLKSSNHFIYVSIFFFLVMAVFVYLLTKRYDRMLAKLNDLVSEIASDDFVVEDAMKIKDLDVVSDQLLTILEQKEDSRKRIEEAQRRLIQHFKLSNTGIALFQKDHKTQYANTHFIQYANMLATAPITDANQLINEPALLPIKRFVEDESEWHNTSMTISHSNRIYEVKALKSGHGSYEITIEDVTEQEKNRTLKQEMTSNITHEIRTPLTSIRGYLEMLKFMDLTADKQREFIGKAYNQVLRLSEMMNDISLLSKLDEEARPFEFQPVNLHQVFEEIRVAYLTKLSEQGDTFVNNLPQGLEIMGNHSLLYSIFQNLVENSLRYAGPNVRLELNCYHQDENHLFFSYFDTGKGVNESQLNRIFERFYRVDGGRTRENGGSGLGLSIVKNAILVHGGQVQARLHQSGGLEILFNLHR